MPYASPYRTAPSLLHFTEADSSLIIHNHLHEIVSQAGRQRESYREEKRVLPRKTENDAVADHHDHRGNNKKCNTVYVSSLMHPGSVCNKQSTTLATAALFFAHSVPHTYCRIIYCVSPAEQLEHQDHKKTHLYIYIVCVNVLCSAAASAFTTLVFTACRAACLMSSGRSCWLAGRWEEAAQRIFTCRRQQLSITLVECQLKICGHPPPPPPF